MRASARCFVDLPRRLTTPYSVTTYSTSMRSTVTIPTLGTMVDIQSRESAKPFRRYRQARLPTSQSDTATSEGVRGRTLPTVGLGNGYPRGIQDISLLKGTQRRPGDR